MADAERATTSGGDDGRLTLPLAYRAVLLAFGLLLLVLLLPQVLSVALLLVLTTIIALPLAAAADLLERVKVPRALGALLALLFGLGVLVGVVALVAPVLREQAEQLGDRIPSIVDELREDVGDLFGVEPDVVGEEVRDAIGGAVENPSSILGQVADVGITLAVVVGGLVFALITAVYIAAKPGPLVSGVLRLVPESRRGATRDVLVRVREAWLGWLRGSLIDALATGVLTYLGLTLIGLDFAIVFALITAVLEFVPYFGPPLAAIPPVLFALTEGTETALLTLIVFVAIQQIEGNVLLPLVMSRAVDLHPALVAAGVLVFGQLLGVFGVLLAVPLLTAIVILFQELWVPRMDAR